MIKGVSRLAAALLALVALYGLIGFFILPGVALRIANQQLQQYATVPAELQRLEFNPFSLELTLWGLKIGAPDKPTLGFERLYGHLRLDSAWRGVLHLSEVELDKPRTQVAFAKDGTLNLAQLFTLPKSPAAADEPEARPLPVRIDRVRINDGYLRVRDARPSEPIVLLYDSLNLELKHLSTLPGDDAEMTLVAKGPDGGQIDWAGTFSLLPFRSQGTLKVTDGQMKLWWPYVRDTVPLVLEHGRFSLETRYRLDLTRTTELVLDKASLTIAPFALKTRDGSNLLRVANLRAQDASVDLMRQTVDIGTLRSDNLETWVALEADGRLDWQALLAPPADTSALTARNEATPRSPQTTGTPWQIRVNDTRLRGYRVHLADRRPAEPVLLDVGPLNLDVKRFDSLNKTPFTLKLDTGVGKEGRLQATGQVNLAPVSAQLDVVTRDLDLRIAQAYITPHIRLELRSGRLDSDLKVDLERMEPLAFTVTGKAQVDQLHTLDTLKDRDLLKWQRLTLEGLSYVQGDALTVDTATLDQPYARFMINEDRSTNIDDLLIETPSEKAQRQQARTSPPSEPALGIHIGRTLIKNGAANFADFTLTPFFATAVQQLHGTIGTIDNRRAEPARIDIEGKVDRYAPVAINGKLNPFDPMASLDIAAGFRRVELTTLTPYAGKFAGYRIRKGRLNLDLHYVITQGRLVAENEVVVEQLQLGERVDSPDALDLPIRLAVALLKDSKGTISLSLPVSGDLRNPQFQVMPIVWQTLRNLALRAVQSPFRFIGGLVAGGDAEDLSTVSFVPGSSELDASARASLDTLAAALAKRPKLRLEIEGTSAQASDGPLIAQQRLEREYQTTWYKVLQRRGDKVPADASLLQVKDEDKPALLEGIYRTRLKQQPPAEWERLDAAQRTARLRDALLDTWAKSPTLLRLLGQERASSIKDYLVSHGKLADERVYFIDTTLGTARPDGRIVTPLHLDAE
ncbi:DUF748 domain-containing protein [Pseudomonas sp. 22-AL-CL-001]|uniref:DUF748 domain-containing protein n=1 Tax=Pseudomonas alabamensis TaxID=3064349 RepID=UPI002712B330|nr:DUF748 domain-containing protein [Pseudomonas sp. 22-AL-CL-001]MDO7910048.1 DUF748 domain-containing protein [Pseudomonas sp. 22-AL-CL-001]